MRLQRTSIDLLIGLTAAVLALGLLGCRSAAQDLSPVADVPLPEDAPVPEGAAPTALEAAPPDEPAVVAAFEQPVDEASPVEAEPVEEEPTSAPEEIQRWALELCQSAEQLLEDGDAEAALSALDQAYELMLQLPGNGDESYLQAKEDIRLLVADLINRHYRAGRTTEAPPQTSWDLELPMVDNEYVRREIESFTGKEREAFVEGYRRSGRYRPMILAKLEEAGLPSQLSWLPMVESWFKVRAYSRASAVGMWQFISSTGLRYGLSRDSWIDERFDPEKSTDAAIGYLNDLHGMFGDWPKALAGYNCGEARVARLQRRSQNEYLDFWDLYELLPRETRRYVPRLYAAIAIIEDPEKYGMVLPEPDDPYDDVVTVTTTRAVKLEQLDTLLGLDKGTLAGLNPELRHKGTPQLEYALRVPAAHEQTLVAGLSSLPEWRPAETRFEVHRVRRGQSLSVIARRYGTSVNAIMRTNNLRSAHRIREGQTLRIPVRGSGGARTTRTAVNGVHTVRRGESLGAIAQAYGTTVSQIKRDNRLSSNLIHPGQELHVGDASSATTSAGSSGGATYTVRVGDTPGGIADRHGVGLSALLKVNRLNRRSTIYPGQTLVIPK